jgi:hypothetical protein
MCILDQLNELGKTRDIGETYAKYVSDLSLRRLIFVKLAIPSFFHVSLAFEVLRAVEYLKLG